MLTYMENKSPDYLWKSRQRVEFADENYAREIMQLFTIGLTKLNDDGTVLLDDKGEQILSYTNDEIVDYSRIWTAFKFSPNRGNIETSYGLNYIDPMQFEPAWRDSLPKLGLEDHAGRQYVGDKYPLCSDLPKMHFLKAGATYVLRGSANSSKYQNEPDLLNAPGENIDIVRMELDENSDLYAELCDKDSETRRCRFPSKIVLDTELRCFGIECEIETPRMVQVEPGIYYEYLRMPCAFQSYFSGGKVVGNHYGTYACGDPRTQTGQIACCAEGERKFMPEFGRFSGERVSYAEAERICSLSGLQVCEGAKPRTEMEEDDYWMDLSCTQQAKIYLDGRVGIVHSIPQKSRFDVRPSVSQDTKTYFGALWSPPGSGMDVDDLLPDYDGLCDSLGCGRDSFDKLCLCDVEVRESAVFNSAPTREEVLQGLHIGAFSPSFYWESSSVSTVSPGVKMYSIDGKYSRESVFEVFDDNGVQRFLKNSRSDVVVGDSSKRELLFRNPPHLISIHDADVRDIYYETDAALDHYFVSI